MPAKDRYHDTVVHALQKSGWTISAEQVALILTRRRLWIDIQATRAREQITILVEVKTLEATPSPVEALAAATGKYLLYQAALQRLKIDIPLFLAVPTSAYHGILSEELGQFAIQETGMKLLVFNPDKEEIVRWIT